MSEGALTSFTVYVTHIATNIFYYCIDNKSTIQSHTNTDALYCHECIEIKQLEKHHIHYKKMSETAIYRVAQKSKPLSGIIIKSY